MLLKLIALQKIALQEDGKVFIPKGTELFITNNTFNFGGVNVDYRRYADAFKVIDIDYLMKQEAMHAAKFRKIVLTQATQVIDAAGNTKILPKGFTMTVSGNIVSIDGCILNITEHADSIDVQPYDPEPPTPPAKLGKVSYHADTMQANDFIKLNALNHVYDDKTKEGSFEIDLNSVTSLANMFESCDSMLKVVFEVFDSSAVTDMSYMFNGCEELEAIEFGNYFDTTNVTSFDAMFKNCYALQTVDVSAFKTGKSTKMTGMFANCKALTAINVSGFDTSNVLDMTAMFAGCEKLAQVDVSKFDVSKCVAFSQMFQGCAELHEIYISDWKAEYAKAKFDGMFAQSGIVKQPTDVIFADNMYTACKGLVDIVIPANTSEIGPEAFLACSNLGYVVCNAVVPPKLGADAFGDIAVDAQAVIPTGTLAAYQNSDWNKFFSTFVEK